MINTVIRYLQRTVGQFPDKVAFRDKRESITFAGLDKRARELANTIHQKLNGTIKQSVGVYLPRSVSCVTAFMGVAYSGNYYTPLDTAMPKERLDKIMSTLVPALIVTDIDHQKDISGYPTVLVDQLGQENGGDQLLYSTVNEVIDTDILYVMFTSGSTGEPKGVIVTHRAVIDYVD